MLKAVVMYFTILCLTFFAIDCALAVAQLLHYGPLHTGFSIIGALALIWMAFIRYHDLK